jgi:hypothetical protein
VRAAKLRTFIDVSKHCHTFDTYFLVGAMKNTIRQSLHRLFKITKKQKTNPIIVTWKTSKQSVVVAEI